MATILDRYGIKEVADVTFYEILESDSPEVLAENSTLKAGDPGAPVLYLDTLKVSTIEQTAENTSARGGKGNAELVTWDYGKEISVTLEDALYSAKSMAIQFGNGKAAPGSKTPVMKTLWKENMKDATTAVINGVEVKLTSPSYYSADGKKVEDPSAGYAYVTGTVEAATSYTIDVSANSFPGTYYVTGDTYARSEITGKDDFFQFIIPKAKVLSESNTITLEAEGDPTVFSMNLKVLRPKDGVMMKLVQYTVAEPTGN
jgi:hypothetical protein